MRPTVAAALAIAIALAACQTVPTATGQVIEEAGPQPSKEAALGAIRAHLARTLRDPDSVKQFAILSGPQPFQARTRGGALERGWLVCAEYNATNGFGGYTGLQGQAFPMRYHAGELVILSGVAWAEISPGC